MIADNTGKIVGKLYQARLFPESHATNDGVVLHVGMRADHDVVDVAAQSLSVGGVIPDARFGVFPESHATNEVGAIGNKDVFGEGGRVLFVALWMVSHR